jgi:hypothetical protein
MGSSRHRDTPRPPTTRSSRLELQRHAHDFLIGLQSTVSYLNRPLKRQMGLLHFDHHIVRIDRFSQTPGRPTDFWRPHAVWSARPMASVKTSPNCFPDPFSPPKDPNPPHPREIPETQCPPRRKERPLGVLRLIHRSNDRVANEKIKHFVFQQHSPHIVFFGFQAADRLILMIGRKRLDRFTNRHGRLFV